ncbi:TPA: hypothetical protein KRH32_000108 [Clostridioides difficile]|nr:hypothetical protein [Clostridioides difficile]HBG8448895.1 hypothetical protein [Clostridioides difficile]
MKTIELNQNEIRAIDAYLSSNPCKSGCGYDVQDWIDDIKSKLDILTINEERSKLEEMEIKLMELLSNEKKVELEINKIESML